MATRGPKGGALAATRPPDLVLAPPALAGVERVEPAEPKPYGYGWHCSRTNTPPR